MLLLVGTLLVRRLLIQRIGSDVNGLNALYTSVIGVLAVAELGVGSAIIYSMYRPIIAGDRRQVAALYRLHRQAYRVIGGVIFGAGLLVMPFLPRMISDREALNVNIYTTFLLTLTSVCLTYQYSAKASLIEAYKDNYITTAILTVSGLARLGLQAAVILIWASYEAYLTCQIIETLLSWGLTNLAARRRHGAILQMRGTLEPSTRLEVRRNVRAMFMHKVGTILVNSIDSVLISIFIGVAVLGKYSNYVLLAGVAAGTISLFFSPLTSVVGHLCATADPAQAEAVFNRFYCLNYILGVVCFLGYFAVADSVIELWVGAGQRVSRAILYIIALNQFTSFMRRTTLLFRDASGTFYHDRWKPVAEGVINLVLSLLFVIAFPEEYRIVGVIVATIITTLTVCDIVEPWIVFRHVFKKSPKRFYLKSYLYYALFVVCLSVMTRIVAPSENSLVGMLKNGALSVGVSLTALGLLSVADGSFRGEAQALTGRAINLLRRKAAHEAARRC